MREEWNNCSNCLDAVKVYQTTEENDLIHIDLSEEAQWYCLVKNEVVEASDYCEQYDSTVPIEDEDFTEAYCNEGTGE